MRFERFAADCRAAGLATGAYIFLTHHYYNKNKGSVETARAILNGQIDALLETLAGQGVTSWVALDQELEAGQTMALAPAENTALLNEAAARLRQAGYAPCVYCSASWAKSRLDVGRLGCPVWLAYYYADPDDPDFDGCAALENLNTAWGEYTRSLGRKLCGWQFGRIGYGAKYGVGSANVDRDWIDLQPEEEEEETPVYTSNTLKIGPVSTGDRAAIRALAESLSIPARDEGDYLIVGPMGSASRDAVAGRALARALAAGTGTRRKRAEKSRSSPRAWSRRWRRWSASSRRRRPRRAACRPGGKAAGRRRRAGGMKGGASMDNSNIFLAVKAAIVGVFGAFGAAFGWLGWLVLAWVACMAVDWLSGSSAAMQAGRWSSARARGGIWHKAGMIVVVIVAALADAVLGTVAAKVPGLPVEYTVLLLPMVLVWYILTELGSILENAAAMGAPVPQSPIRILANAKDTVEDASGEA